MNLKNAVPAALAIVVAASGLSFASDAVFVSNVSRVTNAVREGASGVSLIRVAKKVNSSSTWAEISKNAYPEWPGIQFPDGQGYRVDGLCSTGRYLKVTHTKAGSKCTTVVNNESGDVCMGSKKIALVTPINHLVKKCVATSEGSSPIGGGQEGNYPSSFQYCSKWTLVKAQHALTYDVPVYGLPASRGEGGDDAFGALLFKKSFTIPACN